MIASYDHLAAVELIATLRKLAPNAQNKDFVQRIITVLTSSGREIDRLQQELIKAKAGKEKVEKELNRLIGEYFRYKRDVQGGIQ